MISKKTNKLGILNLISDTFTYGLGSAIQKVLSLAIIFLISKEFTVEEFGIFDFYLIFSNLIVMILVFGQDQAIARLFYNYSSFVQRQNLISESFIFQLILAIIFFPLNIYILELISINYEINLYERNIGIVISFLIFLVIFFNFCINILRWDFKKKYFIAGIIGNSFLSLIAILYLKFYGNFNILNVFYCYIVSNLILSIYLFIKIKKWIIFPNRIHFLKKIFKYGAPLGLISVLTSSLVFIERSVILNYFSEYHLGIYAIAGKLALIIFFFIQSFQLSWGPFAFKTFQQKNIINKFNLVAKTFIFSMITILFSVCFWSENLIIFFSSKEYLEAKILIFPLSLAYIIYGLGNIINIGIKLAKRSELNLFSNLIFYLFTIFFFYFFISKNIFIGIAWSIVFGQIILLFLEYYFAQKVFSMKWKFLKSLFISILFLFLFYFLIKYNFNIIDKFLIYFILNILIFTIFYFIIIDAKDRKKIYSFCKIIVREF